MEESFLLVSLEEEKAKQLAQVLSNDTARKILEHLATKEHATETEIANKLKIPLSTVHYNMSLLVKAKLVNDDSYTYSEKGKQIIHYSLSNKYVIIAPKKTELLKQKLKEFLPVLGVAGVVALGIKKFWPINFGQEVMLKGVAMTETADMALRATTVADSQEFALWFLYGSLFVLLLYFVWSNIILRKK